MGKSEVETRKRSRNGRFVAIDPSTKSGKAAANRFRRLRTAIERSRDDLRKYRDNHFMVLQELTGKWFFGNKSGHSGGTSQGYNLEDPGGRSQPINMLELAFNTYTSTLAAQNPQVLINTPEDHLERTAMWEEVGMNTLLKQIRFVETAQELLAEILSGIGVIKVGSEMAGNVVIGDMTHAVGKPWANVVYTDNFGFDTLARRYEDCDFVFDRFRMPLQDVLDDDSFDKKARNALEGQSDSNPTEGGEPRLEELTTGSRSLDDGMRDYVELYSIWMQRENRIVIVPVNGDKPVLADRPFKGPRHGPYHLFRFNVVPGNIMPMPPAGLWMDIQKAANTVLRKVIKTSDAAKDVYVSEENATEVANEVRQAGNNDFIPGATGVPIQKLALGEVRQDLLLFTTYLRDLFSYLAGNLDALGGLGPQAETLGQEEIIKAGSSKRMQYYSSIFERGIKRVMEDLHFYQWNTHVAERSLTREIPDTGFKQRVEYTPELREGEFTDYELDVQPYSMHGTTPQAQARVLRDVWHSDVLPLAPLLAQQGIVPDVQGYFEKLSKLLHVPDIRRLLIFVEGQQEGVGDTQNLSPAVTERNYTRTNIPQASRQGNDQSFMTLMAGGKIQESNANALSTPGG